MAVDGLVPPQYNKILHSLRASAGLQYRKKQAATPSRDAIYTVASNSQVATEEQIGKKQVEQGESTPREQRSGHTKAGAYLRKALFPFSMLSSMTVLPMYDLSLIHI